MREKITVQREPWRKAPPQLDSRDAVHARFSQWLLHRLQLRAADLCNNVMQLLLQLRQVWQCVNRRRGQRNCRAAKRGGHSPRSAAAAAAVPAQLCCHVGRQAGGGGVVEHQGGWQVQPVPFSQAVPAQVGRGEASSTGYACSWKQQQKPARIRANHWSTTANPQANHRHRPPELHSADAVQASLQEGSAWVCRLC